MVDPLRNPKWKLVGARALAAIATPRTLDAQGRQLGGFLMAVDALGAYRWKRPL